ncbi:MAG TPA: hypothetical protein RMH99_16370, partial [Sandaracinaceae bacterium LLY-WYZ-13_1]|nr:hypothetical protein [Sandaracinaceae bacterium LLY-WYZ-13_1]
MRVLQLLAPSVWVAMLLSVSLTGCLVDRTGTATRDGGTAPPDAPMPRPDAAGRDAGETDGGTIDASRPDAAGLDAGRDAGTDAGVDGGVDGGPEPCDPSAYPICDGDTVVRCESGAEVRDPPCPLGCASGACRALDPSNVGTEIALDDGTADLDVGSGEYWVFVTHTGQVVRWVGETSTEIRPEGAEGLHAGSGIAWRPVGDLGVFAVRSLRVRDGGWLVGLGEDPLVILVEEEALVEGRVDVSVHPGTDEIEGLGPGGGAGADDRDDADGP